MPTDSVQHFKGLWTGSNTHRVPKRKKPASPFGDGGSSISTQQKYMLWLYAEWQYPREYRDYGFACPECCSCPDLVDGSSIPSFFIIDRCSFSNA